MEIFCWDTGLNYVQVWLEYYCLGRGRVGAPLFCIVCNNNEQLFTDLQVKLSFSCCLNVARNTG